jgi:NitT/TauT family transport system permease protein
MRWINRKPRRPVVLAVLPFVLLAVLYAVGSRLRLAENPDDKLMPGGVSMVQAWSRMALQVDERTGTRLFWEDTLGSLGRIGVGMAIATAVALVAGMAIGMFPYVRSSLDSLITATSMVPALAVLPILFIVFGVGEVAKVSLIVIGVLPFMIRDLAQRVREIPMEQWVKAQTLGASSLQLGLRVILPQIVPRLIDSVRLALGPAWLFLISAEAISATSGLGYRIFLVRRYLAMDIILPYVAWITVLAFSCDFLLRLLRRKRYAWVDAEMI